MRAASATVSVVIPTTGRPELLRAIRSIRAQLGGIEHEVVVVADGVAIQDLPPQTKELCDTLILTGSRQGGARARNRGVEAGRGKLVAFLDDDDEWLPTKTAEQLKILDATANPGQAVVSCRHLHTSIDRSQQSAPCPRDLIAPGQAVEDYLFRRRLPSQGRASLYTSTLMCDRDLARRVPWDPSLSRHQDWDWLLRLQRAEQVTFAQAAEPLVRIQTGSTASISASHDWQTSLGWAEANLRDNPATYVDFLTAQTLRYALTGRSAGGAREVVRRLVSTRRVPSFGPLLIGLGGLMPRAAVERLLTRAGRTR